MALAAALVGCDLEGSRATHVDPALASEIAAKSARLEQNPTDANLRLQLAALFEKTGQYFQAAEMYREAASNDGRDTRARVGLARAYRALGYSTRAFEELGNCLKLDPGDPECLWESAEVLRKQGSKPALEQARRAYQRFIDVAATHARADEVRKLLRQLDAQLGPETAPASQPASRPAAPPTAPSGKKIDGDASAAALMPDHAGVGKDQDVGELNPFGVAIGRAIKAIEARDPKGAEAAFRAALAIRPGDAGALAGLAETLYQQDKLQEAADTAEKAFAANNQHVQARWIYGLTMIKSGKNIGAAIEAWKALARDDPEYAEQLGVTRTLKMVEQFKAAPKTEKK